MKKQQSKSMDEEKKAKLIEFYVPDGYVKPTRWVPESLRGQVLEFPTRLKKPA